MEVKVLPVGIVPPLHLTPPPMLLIISDNASARAHRHACPFTACFSSDETSCLVR